MPFQKIYRTALAWAMITGAVIALIAGKGTIARSPVVGLVIIGGSGAVWAAYEHKWLRGRLRASLVLLLICVVVGTFGWWVWPQEDTRMEQILLNDEYGAQLPSQFPIGYVVFKLKYGDKLVFYKGLSLIKDYDFNWSTVKYTGNTDDTFELQMPDIIKRSDYQKFTMAGNKLGGPKRVGWSITYYGSSIFNAVCEVLDTDKDGVVFVIGLTPIKQP